MIDHQDKITARRGGLLGADIAREDVPQAFHEREGVGDATDCIQEWWIVVGVFVVVPLRLEKRSEWSLERWYLERSTLNGRLLISIFFLYNLSMGTIPDVAGERVS